MNSGALPENADRIRLVQGLQLKIQLNKLARVQFSFSTPALVERVDGFTPKEVGHVATSGEAEVRDEVPNGVLFHVPNTFP